MRLPYLLCLSLLSACRASAPLVNSASPASVVSPDQEQISPAVQRPQLGADVLPSFQRIGVAKDAAQLLERPKLGSVILRPLVAGTVVQILGELANADGQWLSVAIDGSQGWARATQITPNP